jgi:hypothetical protein
MRCYAGVSILRINRHVSSKGAPQFGHFRLGKVKVESSVLVLPVGENGWQLFWREMGAITLSVFKGSAHALRSGGKGHHRLWNDTHTKLH